MISDRWKCGHNVGSTRRKGLTLVELIVSIAITSILMFAIISSILIATRAFPDADNPANNVLNASAAATQLASELRYAVSILSWSSSMIEFSVADRNSDDAPETIRYEWSGTRGDSLTRTYNSGTTMSVLGEVEEFDLSYDVRTVSEEVPNTSESAETLLASYDSAVELSDYHVEAGKWWAEYFMPALPGNAVSWKVTRVQFRAKVGGPVNGECRVQLQLPTLGNMPSSIVLEEKTLPESTLLDTYLVQEFAFSNISGLSPQQGLCLVLKWVSDADACIVLGQKNNVVSSDSAFYTSSDSSASWSVKSGESLLFSIYGTVTTAGEAEVYETCYVNAVNIRLRTGADQQQAVHTGVAVPNRPEVLQ